MKKEIKTQKAPLPIGPYSQGILIDNFAFISGQIAPEEKDIKTQTEKILKNIKNILEEIQMTLKDIVKVDVYLKDLSLFAEFNEVYQKFFNPPYPARVTVEVSRLPKDALIEIAVIAKK